MSFALFRQDRSAELRKLAEQHFENDLLDEDKTTVKRAATQLSIYTTVGSILGLGLATALAWRVRQNRVKMFEAFRTVQKPTHVKFADGREEAIPDITPLLQPTAAGDFATYAFFGIAGAFLGGDLGLLSGEFSSRRTITKNPQTKARIEHAYRMFRADILKKELQELENGQGGLEL